MKVEDLPVPLEVKELLQSRGYLSLYPPQVEAVRLGVLEGRNLVLASPTASGKTLIAELCAMRHVLGRIGKVLYLTPLRALANEKLGEFKKYTVLRKTSGGRIKVALSTGDYDSSDPWLEKYDIIIATNEKADSLLRHRAKWIESITLVVADEVHVITEMDRGPTLETVLARLLTVNPSLQILALSATVANADELAEWLGAEAVTMDWRPVPLREGVYSHGTVSFNDGSSKVINKYTGNPSIDLALSSVEEGGQALIFVETRRAAVEMGHKAAAGLRRHFRDRIKPMDHLAEHTSTIGEKTKLSEALADQVRFSAAFHHAGLGLGHRRFVEDMFRRGKIKILAATPTLAAGVNLPARLVVINSYERYEPGYGRYPVSVLEYKQFCGRAGRPKYDEYGESVLIARSEDEREFLMEKYVSSTPEKLWSKLASEKSMRPHVLSTIATGFASSEEGVLEFFSKTLFNLQYGLESLKSKLGGVLSFLYVNDMIHVRGGLIEATRLGSRVSELYIDPASAVILKDGLVRGAPIPTELSFLHLISATPDLSPKLHPKRREMGELETFLEDHRPEFMRPIPDEFIDYMEYQEFLADLKSAKILLEWVNEASEEYILEKYGVEPGDLLRLVESAEWLLYATEELAHLLNVNGYTSMLEKLRLRVSKGIKEELIPLVKIEGIGRVRARMLYNSGFRAIQDLRKARISQLLGIPSIGVALAKKIKEQVGGTISSEEWQLLKKSGRGRVEEQKQISEYP
ncbi:MAG: DEAD/DEAH box helicase [Candidatus Bathyarchaeia archaeon]